jgi:hypothetical protein
VEEAVRSGREQPESLTFTAEQHRAGLRKVIARTVG